MAYEMSRSLNWWSDVPRLLNWPICITKGENIVVQKVRAIMRMNIKEKPCWEKVKKLNLKVH